MVTHHAITDRASWLAMRAQDLTASDMAAAIGESPFKTALELYAEKTGHLLPQEETPIMKRGRLLEPVAVSMMQEEHPDWELHYPLGLYYRDEELRLGATPDVEAYIDGKPVNIQIKAVNRHGFERDWAIPKAAPLHYQLQAATEGMLMDASRSMLVVLVVDYAALELFYFDVPRHQEAELMLKAQAVAFWDNVATGRRPAADLKRDAKTLAALYPQSEKQPVLDLSAENELPERLREIVRLRDEIATRKTLLDEHEVYVKDKMGPAEAAELPGWRISWKTAHVKERIQAAYTYRPLRVTQVKLDLEEAAE